MEIVPKIRVDYPEMLAFYAENKHKFDLPAQITWREIVIDYAKHPDHADARRKADQALDRLRHGEDFARVAREMSEGPKAKEGGQWKTSPGSNNVPAINAALDSLPVNQVSAILEGPGSLHLVKVEARRDAGPATFPEVQNEVRDILRRQKFDEAVDVFLSKLRARATVYVPFLEGAPGPEGSSPTSATAVRTPRR
jgi:parvulin-like peptidyl-prolyl isomerase